MDYEKKYKEALERAKTLQKTCDSQAVVGWCEYLFPELCESEDEKIRKMLIEFFGKGAENNGSTNGISDKDILAWLEKQGEIDKTSYDIAEKEKYDFVSGQYIECRASFNEFKEDNSYWLEYIGNDTYIGRSDNILNQKFHITPRQLYRLFTQQHHYPKEDNNVNDETNAPTGYGKYVDECLNEASKHFFSEGEDTYSVADLFYAGVRCGKSWFENQAEQKPTVVIPKFRIGDTMRTKQEAADDITGGMPVVVSIDNEYYHCTNELIAIKDQDDYEFPPINVKQKPTDKVEPKFNVGDWITNGNLTCKVLSVTGKSYELHLYNDDYCHFETDVKSTDKDYHLWTVNDAKDGDVLAYVTDEEDLWIMIYWSLYEPYEGHVHYHALLVNDNFSDKGTCCICIDNLKPATKEQRELLFQKMKEAGYEWDTETHQLKKIEDEEYDGEDYGIDSLWHAKNILEKTLGKVDGYQTDDGILSHQCAITAVKKLYEQNHDWSEEDERMLNHIIGYLNSGDDFQTGIDWLKSLKQRI